MKLDWALEWMPVLKDVGARLRLDGIRIGICLTLEPKTANLAVILRDAGAEVAVHCPATSTTDEVADALRDLGITVFARSTATKSEDLDLADHFLRWSPQILIDDGATMIRRLHSHHPDALKTIWGAAEETTSGIRPLRAMGENLKIPVLAVNDATTKYLFDNVYGTAQSCVMTFVDLTNLQLAGRDVLVIGYGWVGRGLARYLTGLGSRVTVSELDAIKALQALHDGHRVAAFAQAAPTAEVIFSATGVRGSITPEQLAQVRDGVFLAVAGGARDEIPMTYLHGLGTFRTTRSEVQEFTLPDGRAVKVIADGECMNVTAAEGNPIEIMDLSLALQALAVQHLALNARSLTPGVHDLPAAFGQEVANIRLTAAGAALEPLTEELRRAQEEW
ncbi:adenosylhomocysteinase [Kribbella sp. NPDC050124]|uniref:adenosylhomocysteinase n=1 Tax=Kribbella sp. NPDC050124 TaxID=3364114 RepID=UPI0037BA6D68